MRFALLAVGASLVITTACGNKSKLDADPGAGVDAMWDLAPDGTQLGLVATPRAVGLAFRGLMAIRELSAHPDFAPLRPQVDMVMKGLFGSPTSTPEDAGFSSTRGLAMFATSEGVIGVMPVADRDKFMTSKHGARGSAAGSGSASDDFLDGNYCRDIGAHYVCASDPKLFDRLGKGSLRAKSNAGVRGDAELYMMHANALGAEGALWVAASLDVGTLAVRGRWVGTPAGDLAQLVGLTAPHVNTTTASGFVTFNAKPLLAAAPPIPVAGGVTLAQLGASMSGPVSAVIPAGSVDIQLHAPLADLKPAQTIIEHCADLETFFALSKQQTPGACRLVLQGTNALELDVWVEGNELRVGAHKGADAKGAAGGMTPVGNALAMGDWTAAFWGRGTMLNLAGVSGTAADVPPEVALGIHAIALMNELGFALKVEDKGFTFRGYLRTTWENPPEVIAKVTAINGADIVNGRATEPAKAIAASAQGTPFAQDFAAGQGGLMIPAAAIGVATSVVLPVLINALGLGGGEPAGDPAQPYPSEP